MYVVVSIVTESDYFKCIKTDKNNEILINCIKGEIYQHIVTYTYTHDMRVFYNILCNRE
jgi:hypothetical protein